MNVPQSDLDDLARRVETIRVKVWQASAHVRDGQPEQAQARLLELIMMDLPGLTGSVKAAGGNAGEVGTIPDFVSLQHLDTPANRELLRRLQETTTAALRVDRERGIDDGPVSQMLEILTGQVTQEVRGPAGSGE
jgi:hypothetical protein